MNSTTRALSMLLLPVAAVGCASPNLSVSPGEERLPIYRDNPTSGVTALTPSLAGVHDRSPWSTVTIDVPMQRVYSSPNIDWEVFIATAAPRDRGEYPTAADAVEAQPVTGDHVLETVNIITAGGSIILTPIVAWIPPPWQMQGNPDWPYERERGVEPYDGSAWVSEPAPARRDPMPAEATPPGEGRP